MADIELGVINQPETPALVAQDQLRSDQVGPSRGLKVVRLNRQQTEELAQTEVDIFSDGNASRFMTVVFFIYCMFNTLLGIDIILEYESQMTTEIKLQVTICALKWFTSVVILAFLMITYFLLAKLACMESGEIVRQTVGALLPCYAVLLIAQQGYASVVSIRYLAHEIEVGELSNDEDFIV